MEKELLNRVGWFDASLRRVYLPAGILALAIAVIGFWQTYYGRLLNGTVDVSGLIHFHAAVMIGWLLLFGAQAVLAATRRIELHKRLGRVVGWYAVALVIIGIAAAMAAFARRLSQEDIRRAEYLFVLTLHDLVLFVVFICAGWYYRSRPALHRAYMLIATTALLLPAVSRMRFLGAPVPVLQFSLVWLLPIYLAIAWDFVRLRTLRPVYLLGILVLVAARYRGPMADTAPAHAMARWVGRFLVS